jgi:hypothetical protein
MSKAKYLYIDDENDSSIQSIINGFNDVNLIEVEYFPLSKFKEFSNLRNELIKGRKDNYYGGIIIDLRLDGDGPDRVDFNATSITQELRSITARGDIKAFPIILCSTEPKIRETYDVDKSSHDLFDYKFEKSITPNFPKFSEKLAALANGYNELNSNTPSLKKIFGREDIDLFDPRIAERFLDAESKTVVYDFAHFVVKNLFHNTNPLLKERVVAARLGIDIEASGENWNKLLGEVFKGAKYAGLFSDGWHRWWADSIISIFKTLSDKKLSFINANERVKLLEDKTGIKGLIAAKPLPKCISTEFWTICEGYKKPLDPLEGFKIFSSHELKPWQENKYLSLEAIIERIGIEKGLRPHSSELKRIDTLKKKLK